MLRYIGFGVAVFINSVVLRVLFIVLRLFLVSIVTLCWLGCCLTVGWLVWGFVVWLRLWFRCWCLYGCLCLMIVVGLFCGLVVNGVDLVCYRRCILVV